MCRHEVRRGQGAQRAVLRMIGARRTLPLPGACSRSGRQRKPSFSTITRSPSSTSPV
jgi:hypothetical protein